MARAYVVCHMMPSVDGRLRTERWPVGDAAHKEYDRKADSYHADGWLCGRVTMEEFAKGHWRGRRSPVRHGTRRTDHVARKADGYAIALDAEGKLAWASDEVEGDHLIVVVSHDVPEAYLADLRGKGISYLIGNRGGHDIDLGLVVRKLHDRFGIRRLLLEGGGEVNGSFLRAGLVDELSLLVTPVADGGVGEPALFDVETGRKPKRAVSKLRLLSARPAAAGMVWLRYKVGNRRSPRPRAGRPPRKRT